MRSTFGGLNIANLGLFTAQKQIDVTSHNVSNANTEGYSRQRFITSAVAPPGYLNQFTPMARGMVGGGVGTLSLDQIRDRFLDMQYRTEAPKNAYWATRADALYYVEDIFNGAEAGSLDTIISRFFNSVQELSKNPTDEAIRTNVVSEAKKMVDAFHMYHDQLTSLMEQQNTNLVEQSKHVNELLEQLASLNDNIQKFELGGSVANDLRDSRNLLLDELSTFMDISITESSYDPPVYNIYGVELSQMKIYAGSNTGEGYEDFLLIDHKTPLYLEIEEEEGLNETCDENDPQIITHAIRLASGIDLNPEEIEGLNNGILYSYINLRDGDNTDNQGIPYFLAQLDVMVNALVEEFNSIHSDGYTMPFSSPAGSSDSTSGVNFFDDDGRKASTIQLDEAILLSAFNIAASSEYVTMDSDGHMQTGNNNNALTLIREVQQRTDLEDINSFEGFFKNFLGNLASEVSLANGMRDEQNILTVSIQNQRLSIMAVSEDEEMTDLIRFQHAYNAAARCITAMDEALDKLINGTGRVGL